MVCVQVELWPQASVAFQVRFVILSPGQLPDTESVYVMVGDPEQLSVAVGRPVTAGSVGQLSHVKVTSDGHVMIGYVLSRIVMIWLQLLLLPQASVAL